LKNGISIVSSFEIIDANDSRDILLSVYIKPALVTIELGKIFLGESWTKIELDIFDGVRIDLIIFWKAVNL
jgi:hypothetical protein